MTRRLLAGIVALGMLAAASGARASEPDRVLARFEAARFELHAVDGAVWMTTALGGEIWKTDGTVAGTSHTRGVPGAELVRFVARDASRAQAVFRPTWRGRAFSFVTDGTDGGTSPATIIDDAPASRTVSAETRDGEPTLLCAVGRARVFAVRGEVWSTDGSWAGTVRLGAAPNARPTPARVGAWCFFEAGRDVWMTDGTPARTAVAFARVLSPTDWQNATASVGRNVLVVTTPSGAGRAHALVAADVDALEQRVFGSSAVALSDHHR